MSRAKRFQPDHVIVAEKDTEGGTYLPVSVVAHKRGVSGVWIRQQIRQGVVRTKHYPVGPLLVRLEDVPNKNNIPCRGRPKN